MDKQELIRTINLIQWELNQLETRFRKGHWLARILSRCNKCCRGNSVYAVALIKPDLSGRAPSRLTEIVDAYCQNCGDSSIWFSLMAIEPEREVRHGLPQSRTDELCSRCIASEVVGIWRGLNPTAAECRNCGALELPPDMQRRARKYKAMVRLKRIQLVRELYRLLAIQSPQIFKNPFAPSQKG